MKSEPDYSLIENRGYPSIIVDLIKKLLNKDPESRLSMPMVLKHDWFKTGNIVFDTVKKEKPSPDRKKLGNFSERKANELPKEFRDDQIGRRLNKTTAILGKNKK